MKTKNKENKQNQEKKKTKEPAKKGFFARLFDRVDKQLEEKAKNKKCCCKNNK